MSDNHFLSIICYHIIPTHTHTHTHTHSLSLSLCFWVYVGMRERMCVCVCFKISPSLSFPYSFRFGFAEGEDECALLEFKLHWQYISVLQKCLLMLMQGSTSIESVICLDGCHISIRKSFEKSAKFRYESIFLCFHLEEASVCMHLELWSSRNVGIKALKCYVWQ